MIALAPEEFEWLAIARAVVQGSSFAEVERFFQTSPTERGGSLAQLGPTAAGLLQDTLAKGVVRSLCRDGGAWPIEGKRLWQRCEPPELHFSPASRALLEWLLNAPAAEKPQVLKLKTPSAADELLLVLTLRLVEGSSLERALLGQDAVRRSAACALWAPVGQALSFETPAVELMLEGWQAALAARWERLELSKCELTAPEELGALGDAQHAVLNSVLEIGQRRGHREWLGFVIEAAARLVEHGPGAEALAVSLDPTTPLKQRVEARAKSASFWRGVARLRGWDEEHRAVRFFEDGYGKAQWLVRSWERLGDAGFRQAQARVEALERAL